MEAEKKMEKGPPERQRRLISGFWTFSLSTTFPEITSLRSFLLTSLEGEEEGERKRWRKIRFLDFFSFHDFSRSPVFLGEVEQTPVAAGGSLKNSAGKYVVKNRLVANVEAKKKMEKGPPRSFQGIKMEKGPLRSFQGIGMEKGPRGHSKESGGCHQVQANLATFKATAMHGSVTTNRMRSDSIAGASSGGEDFVPDAVGDVTDRDLRPGFVLGGGGGEDVVEEVWWRAWRRRKRLRKGLQGHSKESGQCHKVQANLATFEASAMHGFVTTNRMRDWAVV
jgi:hypothetical protein